MPKTRKMLCVLLLAATAPLLAACAHDPIMPDQTRFARVPLPIAPRGEALCEGSPCLSERESADLFNATIDTACEANDRLAWLSDYFLGTNLGPTCDVEGQ